eukprot:2920580-Amphidinium_carterae.1
MAYPIKRELKNSVAQDPLRPEASLVVWAKAMSESMLMLTENQLQDPRTWATAYGVCLEGELADVEADFSEKTVLSAV